MPILDDVRATLGEALQLGDRTGTMTRDTPLLGALPELDSMAVVTVITAFEDYYGFTVDDDEISADTFETLGSLADFVERKTAA